MNFGVIGYGYTGQQHARAVENLPGVDLVAVAEIDPRKRHQARAPAFEHYGFLLDDRNIDAVSICLPHALHAKVGAEALTSGKHVLMEKPLAISVASGEHLCRLAKSTSRVLMVEMTHRFMPPVIEARELVQNGEVGEIMAVTDTIVESSDLLGTSPSWRYNRELAGGGVGFSGIHLFDHTAWVTSQRLTLDCARFGFSQRLGNVEDTAAYSLHLANGAPVHILLCRRTQGKGLEGRFSIFGSKGTLQVDVWSGWSLETEPSPREKVSFRSTLSIPERALEGMKGALAEFFAAIREVREPDPRPEESLESQRLMEQAYLAFGDRLQLPADHSTES
jgi:predicted dehydrogenase